MIFLEFLHRTNLKAEAAELMQKGAFLNFDDAYTEIFEYIEVYRTGDPV